MPEHATIIPEDRPLTDEEENLTQWLLSHWFETNDSYLAQLGQARVVSRCSCGCASVDFSVNGVIALPGAMAVLADYSWQTPEGWQCGVFVFARDGLLAGLEVWSVDGLTTPNKLPRPDELQPIRQ